MTSFLTAGDPKDPTRPFLLWRLLDGLTDVGLLSFAVWTITYHLGGLRFRLEVDELVRIWLAASAVLAVGFVALRFFARAGSAPEPAPEPVSEPVSESASEPGDRGATATLSRRLLWPLGLALGIGAGVTAGLYRDQNLSWTIPCVLGGLAVAVAAVGVFLGRRERGSPSRVSGSLVALLAAGSAATLSLYTVNTDGDDVFYVSRSIRTAQTGRIPLKDVIFTQGQVGQISGEPPVPSYEVLVGGIARLLHLPAQNVLWFIALPGATFFAVWALWRLTRAWAPRRALLCFAVAAVYLLWTGQNGASFGSFHLVRLWQGKAIFVSLLVPLLYLYLTRWAENRSFPDLALLFAAGTAGVGLTTTSTFIVPLIAAAAVVPLAVTGRFRAALGACVALVYPVGAGLMVALNPESNHQVQGAIYDASSTFGRVLLTGTMGVIAGCAVWAAPWLARRGIPALITSGGAAIFTILMIPGTLELIARLTHAGQVLWRVPWVVPVPVLVGLIAAIPLPGLLRWLAPLPAAVLIATMIPTGLPIWSFENDHTRVEDRPAWKVSDSDVVVVKEIVSRVGNGGVVLAPQRFMRWFPLVTTRVNAVNPQSRHLTMIPADPSFAADRELLTALARYRTATMSPAAAQAALLRVGVTNACLNKRNSRGQKLLKGAGFTVGRRLSFTDHNGVGGRLVCLKADPAKD
ncbi:MAG: DUF6077 domain-containing protein [Streptosporangiaceae bacterium]